MEYIIPRMRGLLCPRVLRGLARQAYSDTVAQTSSDTVAQTSSDTVAQTSSDTVAQTSSEVPIALCRTPQSDPRQHSLVHECRFYCIPEQTRQHLFTHGGLPRTFMEQIQPFQELCLMVRRPALEIMAVMKQTSTDRPATRFVLYGDMGNGKTLTMAHVLHYAYVSDWILVHVPWAANWMRNFKEVAPSAVSPGMVDHTLDAALWLQHFRSQNTSSLQKLKLVTSRRYEWSSRESTESGVPLDQVIEFGVARAKFACQCVSALLSELSEQASAGRFKLLAAVDGANALFSEKSRVLRVDRSVVPPSLMTLPKAFYTLLQGKWSNGVVVAIVDQIAELSPYPPSPLPWCLLTKRGFKHLDPFLPLQVEAYTPKELDSCLAYYDDRHWLQHPASKTTQGQQQFAFLSNYNPYQLMQLTAAY